MVGGAELEATVGRVEVETVFVGKDVPQATGEYLDLFVGDVAVVVVLTVRVVVLAEVVVFAVVALAVVLLFHALDEVAGLSVGLFQLLWSQLGVDFGGVPERPVVVFGRVIVGIDVVLEIGGRAEDAVEYHLARGDAVALPDGVVFGVGFVDGHEDFGELGSVVGDL